MLRKKDSFTIITPIPGFIPRQLAIDILHSHSEVITLNPLVLEHKPIPAPQNAETDEYYSTWYEITERIQFLPGIGKMGSSTIKFNGCFHDMPWGLQTHIYAPMNVDLRNTYRIAGNQPGFEPPEVPEIGLKALGAPSDGLYLREDIEIKCNVTVHSFVKSQLKKAGSEMVRRIIMKAELLDAGVLQAMIEDGKLKTINPADRSTIIRSPLPSPTNLRYSPSISGNSPPMASSPRMPYHIPRVQSVRSRPGSGYSHHQGSQGFEQDGSNGVQELAATRPSPPNQFPVEMPGDFYHASADLQPNRQSPQPAQPRPPGNSLVDPNQARQSSPNPAVSGQWSAPGSRPASFAPSLGSPGLDNKGFPPQLAPHQETTEEYQEDKTADGRNAPLPRHAPYNPADYAKIQAQQHPRYGHGQLGQRYNYT